MNQDQQDVLNAVKIQKNIFLTGAAGTGKSYTIQEIVSWCRDAGKLIGITASTGTAAITIGGRTLHSFLGIGLAKQEAMKLYLAAKKYPKTIEKLKLLDFLIIDEISMIPAELLDKISEYLCLVRRNRLPFGGIQVLFCGDMCQLPPVNGDYPFRSAVWGLLNLANHELTTVIRQESDAHFREILESARWGQISDEQITRLEAQRNQTFGEVEPTKLFAKNVNVDSINLEEYTKLRATGAKERTYFTIYATDKYSRVWADSLKIPESVPLCIGAQVMLTANLSVEDGYANGTRCMVTELRDEGPVVVFKDGSQLLITHWTVRDENERPPRKTQDRDDDEEDDEGGVWVSYIPIKLAWALTIHKSQSMTLDAAVIDIGPSIFECGQAYTALSRVRDLDSVRILNVSKTAFRTHPSVLEFYGKSEE